MPNDTVLPVFPVQTLREHADALEAAMTLVLAEPDKAAVHKLRSMTRRLEAQVSLLTQIDTLPADAPSAARLRKRIRKLRRAAGRVRDLDVLHDMLADDPMLRSHDHEALRATLASQRERKAAKLQRMLLGHLPKVVGAVEGLLHSIGNANGVQVPAISLLPLIERWRAAQEDGVHPQTDSDEHLHNTRKVAKTARFMAESASAGPAAAKAAAQYEALQDAGGHWHDWLQLTSVARKQLGRKHPLTVIAAEQTENARAEFLKLLG